MSQHGYSTAWYPLSLSFIQPGQRPCTHTHATPTHPTQTPPHRHKQTHADTQTHTDTHVTHRHTNTCVLLPSTPYLLPTPHTLTHTLSLTHTPSHTHSFSHTHTNTHTCGQLPRAAARTYCILYFYVEM